MVNQNYIGKKEPVCKTFFKEIHSIAKETDNRFVHYNYYSLFNSYVHFNPLVDFNFGSIKEGKFLFNDFTDAEQEKNVSIIQNALIYVMSLYLLKCSNYLGLNESLDSEIKKSVMKFLDISEKGFMEYITQKEDRVIDVKTTMQNNN